MFANAVQNSKNQYIEHPLQYGIYLFVFWLFFAHCHHACYENYDRNNDHFDPERKSIEPENKFKYDRKLKERDDHRVDKFFEAVKLTGLVHQWKCH